MLNPRVIRYGVVLETLALYKVYLGVSKTGVTLCLRLITTTSLIDYSLFYNARTSIAVVLHSGRSQIQTCIMEFGGPYRIGVDGRRSGTDQSGV